MRYIDPDGRESKKYGIKYISYERNTTQKYRKTNQIPGYYILNKCTEKKTEITFYGNEELAITNFQIKSKMPERKVFSCNVEDLQGDVQEILKSIKNNVIVETESSTTVSYYLEYQESKHREETPEIIKAIYVLNADGGILDVIKNETE